MSTRPYARRRTVIRKRAAPSSYVIGHGAYRRKAAKPRMQAAAPRRRQVAVRGKGDYKSTIGAQIGSTVGGLLGYGAQQLVKYITGFGDYHITSNSLMGGLYDPPEVRNLRSRCVVVRHREYITDINATSTFTLQSFPINPGLAVTFPWLSQVAEAFEEYYITGMIFEYKTMSADYTTASSAALGSVIMATQYNVLNPNFPDKVTMENYEFANSAKPSETFIHPIECKKSSNPVSELFVRTGTPPIGDLRLYDLGNFMIATQGCGGTGVIGELWCTFEVVFCKPKLVSALGYELLTDHWQLGGTINGSNPLGTDNTLVDGSNLGTSIATNVLSFPANLSDGFYMITYVVFGTAAAITAPLPGFSGCLQQEVWNNDTFVSTGPTTGTVTNVLSLTWLVKIISRDCTITYGTAGTLPTTPTGADLWITQVNGAIIT